MFENIYLQIPKKDIKQVLHTTDKELLENNVNLQDIRDIVFTDGFSG